VTGAYIEGQNLTLYVRWPQGTFEQDPSAATDLLRAKVDVIVAWSTPAVIGVSHATVIAAMLNFPKK
jgi:hypothetical protein